MFSISSEPLNRDELHQTLAENKAGAIVVFEGWVRNHNEGKQVSSLEYQVYRELAQKEGAKILEDARVKFNLHGVLSVHREGHLKLGDIAIWIGATASHRDDAFKATRYIIDEIKHRLPVWKKEHYVSQKAEWVFCKHHHHHVHFEENDYYQKQKKLVDQAKLKEAKVLVVGAGGLGCPALINLATAGVGHITIVDFDQISLSNIHRQFLFSPNLVGEKKAIVAGQKLREVNPFIHVKAVTESFNPSMVVGHDLVLDCTDNMSTKYFIHDACFKEKTPLISAGVYQFEGQVRTFLPERGCLRCFSSVTPDDSKLGNCNDFGVLGTTTSILGSIQASEAIEFLLHGVNTSFESTVFLNTKTLSQMKIKNSSAKDCLVCQGKGEVFVSGLEVDSLSDAQVIDIRELSDDEISQLSFHKKTLLCCHRGIRSKKWAEKLRSEGHQNVYSLRGGASSYHGLVKALPQY